LVFFGAITVAAAFLLTGTNKADTAAAAFIMDLIPVQSMSSSPDFLLALLLAARDGLSRYDSQSLPTTVFLLAFILSDSSEGGVWL
jgi:hypothetical protein